MNSTVAPRSTRYERETCGPLTLKHVWPCSDSTALLAPGRHLRRESDTRVEGYRSGDFMRVGTFELLIVCVDGGCSIRTNTNEEGNI
ncbi:hypothetical protein AVEN_25890-1 [Araneus ventricosus]|uniref:Uncharacterized protein n=1 Tax=Araneus ventricosus TaxID=182803 RepID=A0A4Y2FBK3_ARAVE|nr:hypothetical protein AVEN_25890-1 [Araneus ventricosus]